MEKYILIKQGDKPEETTIESQFFDTFEDAFQALAELDRTDLAITTREIT